MNSAYRILEQRFNEKNTLEHIIALIDLDGQLNAPASAANAAGGIFTTTAHLIPISLSNAVTACKLTASADNSSSITWVYR